MSAKRKPTKKKPTRAKKPGGRPPPTLQASPTLEEVEEATPTPPAPASTLNEELASKLTAPRSFGELTATAADSGKLVEDLLALERAGRVVLDWRDGPGESLAYAVHAGRYLHGAWSPSF